MKCPSCGTKNKDGMKFCKICGAPLHTSKDNNIYEDNYILDRSDNGDKKQSNKKTGKGIVILIISIIVVMIAIGACVAILLLNNSSSSNGEDNRDDDIAVATETANTSPSTVLLREKETDKVTEQPTTATIVTVPDVVGMNQKDAENKLDNSNLSVIVQEGEDDSMPNGYVISQSPVAGKTINKGEAVTIYISKSQANPPTISSNNSSTTDNKKYLYCCASDFATLRNRPSRSGSEIVKITTREKVEYLGKDGEFYYVSYKGDKGYVLADFFSEDINAPLNYGTGNL